MKLVSEQLLLEPDESLAVGAKVLGESMSTMASFSSNDLRSVSSFVVVFSK